MKIAAVVPSLNPDDNLIQVVDGLISAGFSRIYVVDDGSGKQYAPIFDQASRHPSCTLLIHTENMGKGRALKTAFSRYVQDNEGLLGAITLDADGQHSIEDVVKIATAMSENPDSLILGVRDFDKDDVPPRSAFGNKITRNVFRFVGGVKITDTQTGLRGIPDSIMQKLISVRGERYEYETTMLLEVGLWQIPIKEVPIHTIYINDNSGSHFRTFHDSFRIYWLIFRFSFLKFIGSSLASTLLDYGLFSLLFYVIFAGFDIASRLFFAVCISRICSAIFNYWTNKKLVFYSNATVRRSLPRYAVVCVIQMLCSYGLIYLFSEILFFPTMLSKIVIDSTLFFLSFYVQRRWVFGQNTDH